MRLLLPILLLLWTAPAPAQALPAVGTATTLDVATWNIEHFGNPNSGPQNEELQRDNVAAILTAAEIDLWSLQELDYQDAFNELLELLGEPYAGVRVNDNTSFPIGYGFIYNTEVIQPTEVRKILTNRAYYFAYRPPLQLRSDVVLPDTTLRDVHFINIHAKAMGDAESYERRVAASGYLKDYVDGLIAEGTPVLVLGDFNDELRRSTHQGKTSPYQNFRDDSEGYFFATDILDLYGIPTWCANLSCSSGSVLDHILVSAPLFESYEAGSMNRYDAVLTAIPNYVRTTSDHLPVYARFAFERGGTAAEDGAAPGTFALRPAFPNPFREETTLTFELAEAAEVRLEVFDALGRRVALLAEGPRPAGTHAVAFRAEGLAPGLYVARLAAGGRTATRRLLHVG